MARKLLAAYLMSSAVSSDGEEDRRLDQIERPVELAQRVAGALGLGADHHPVGAHEILDRRALAQELGIGGDVELAVRPAAAQDLGDLAPGADRHGRFGHDHGIAGERGRDFLGRGEDIGQIGMAVAAPRRRADGDEDGIGAGDGGAEIGGEAQAPGRGVGGDDLLQARLVDRHLAALQSRAILPASLSTQVTSTPNSEKQAPETSPT